MVRIPSPAEVYAFIEVSDSSLSKDEGPKRDLYERFGIEDYLVVDIARARVMHYCLSKTGRYGEPRVLEYGDTFAFTGLPDIILDVGRFLAPR